MRRPPESYKRIVVKIGSSLLCSETGAKDCRFFGSLCDQVAKLAKAGKEIVLVSSGAIAFGMHLLELKERPKQLYSLQASAAVGQNELINRYRAYLEKRRVRTAQILLSYSDFEDRRRYLNARNTIETLFKYGVVPVVNENDTVSTEEIKFGDNDKLSALTAKLISADLLIMLSDVDGLMDNEKNIVRVVNEVTLQIKSFACPTRSKACVGGMITKIEAAKITMDSGIASIIANGHRREALLSAVKNPAGTEGTLFIPKKNLEARKHWIAHVARIKGKITVDDGAKKALTANKSLLSVGVVSVEGVFDKGDVVALQDVAGCEFARGRAGISSRDLDKVKGARHTKEALHRDNIVIL